MHANDDKYIGGTLHDIVPSRNNGVLYLTENSNVREENIKDITFSWQEDNVEYSNLNNEYSNTWYYACCT